VVQRAVNALRFVAVRSVLFELSALRLQSVPVRSALFTRKMSHCVSGSETACLHQLHGGGDQKTYPFLLLLPRIRINESRVHRVHLGFGEVVEQSAAQLPRCAH